MGTCLKDTKEIEGAISEQDDMEPAEVLEAVTAYKGEPPPARLLASFLSPGCASLRTTQPLADEASRCGL